MQELHLQLDRTTAALSQELGRPPTTAEIAKRAGVLEEDESMVDVEHRVALSPLIAKLPPRQQKILHLRFFEGLTQSEIATRLGISQMHVSRLLARSLAQLREDATEE